jgi:hypothetical protein
LKRKCVDAVAKLGAEDVVDEAVLGDTAQALKGRSGDYGVEMVTVSGDLRAGPRDRRLDALLELVWTHRHAL